MTNNLLLLGQKFLLAFDGLERPSPELFASIQRIKPAGFTLFRGLNFKSLPQLGELTSSLQKMAGDLGVPPFLICADQEGGQLMAVGDCTPLPGNMALGATRSSELAFKAGQVLGAELAALGINVNYAPSADVNNNPRNPVIGVRSFGDDPALVGALAAAVVEGIQSQGVAATVKHFPGHGDTQTDSHAGLSTLSHDLERLRAVELPPFSAAIKAGVKMVMTAHLGVQALDGENPPPATLSRRVLTDLLRNEMGFDGVIVSDAMDMGAIRQGEHLGEETVTACLAGIDLLLLTGNPKDQARIYDALTAALTLGTLPREQMQRSIDRIIALKEWIAAHPARPEMNVIRSPAHLRVADQIAEKSITLVRDRDGMIPLQLPPAKRVAVIVPQPQDLTPADTSSYEKPRLAEAIREYHPLTDGFIVPFAPSSNEISDIIQNLGSYDLIVTGTINAFTTPPQSALIQAILRMEKPVVVVALRLPYDLELFPQAGTCLCTYSILEPSMRAVAKALFGKNPIEGRLPVNINAS